MGKPPPSTTSITLVPLPRLVLPTATPSFGRHEATVQEHFSPLDLLLPVQEGQQFAPDLLPGAVRFPRPKPPPAGGREAVFLSHVLPAISGMRHMRHVKDAV